MRKQTLRSRDLPKTTRLLTAQCLPQVGQPGVMAPGNVHVAPRLTPDSSRDRVGSELGEHS